MLVAMSVSTGTISFNRWMKESEGGSKRLMLNTLGSIKILWPVPEFPCLVREVSVVVAFCRDLETSPGTEVLSSSSSSSLSVFISVFCSISESLNIFCIEVSTDLMSSKDVLLATLFLSLWPMMRPFLGLVSSPPSRKE